MKSVMWLQAFTDQSDNNQGTHRHLEIEKSDISHNWQLIQSLVLMFPGICKDLTPISLSPPAELKNIISQSLFAHWARS